MVVLAVTLKPGKAPHPPHQHAEEEFMILADGTGTWHLDGKEWPARKGDVVYAAPWIMHGLKNTSTGPLTYYMVKWNNKGVKAPGKPAGGLGVDLVGPMKSPAAGGQPKDVSEQKERTRKLTGKVKVLDAHTLQFQGGIMVELNGLMDAPDLEQKGLIGDSFYPCGRQAADFLKRLIGNREVTCYHPHKRKDGKLDGHCFVGEKSLDVEMVRNGWAISAHLAMEGWEAIARENKRGLWRGKFIAPQEWRLGERLPEEPLPRGYQVNDHLCPFFVETTTAGHDPGKATSLVCAYEGKSVVMVYTWEINPAVIQLIKKVDEATAKQKDKRLAGYVVLLCESQDREKELKARHSSLIPTKKAAVPSYNLKGA
jgi:endonuclease YncB( thermonuclease family)